MSSGVCLSVFKFFNIFDHPLFQGEIIRKSRKYTLTKFKNLLLQKRWANFNQTWQKAPLDEGNSSLFKWKAALFPKERILHYLKKSAYTLTKIKISFSRTTQSISNKLGTKHFWVKGIQGLFFFKWNTTPISKLLRWNNYEIAKI